MNAIRLRAALAALLCATPAFSGDVVGLGESAHVSAPVAPAVVSSMPQFNAWLVSANSGLNLAPTDLAAISYAARPALAAAPVGAAVQFNAASGQIVITPQAATAAGVPADAAAPAPLAPAAAPTAAAASAAPGGAVVIPLSSLPHLRENLANSGAQAQAWMEALKNASDPQSVVASLDRYFDGSSLLDPRVHTLNVLSGQLPESVRTPYDESAAARQRAALLDWQHSPAKTYVLVNSYSFKDDGTPGLNYYDMRSLAQILWAAAPGTNVIFVTALPIDEAMIDHVLRGHPNAAEMRQRIHFVALGDSGTDFLSQKLLDPKHTGKLAEIRGLIDKIGAPAVLYPYMGGPYEWQIARELGIPDSVYAAHPSTIYWGTKSGGRKVFKAAMKRYAGTAKVRLKLSDGAEDLYDLESTAEALEALQTRHPEIVKVAVKLNLGSSGEGNIFPDVKGWPALTPAARLKALRDKLEGAKVGIPDDNGRIDSFASILKNEGAALEEFIPGIDRATFPSVQSEIRPDGSVRILSSHEQILVDRNTYVGATLSADAAYRKVLERAAYEVAVELAKRGVVGRLGTDFAAIKQADGGYDVYYIENNIRLTGTTHPLVAAAGLTGGEYDKDKGAIHAEGRRAPVRYKSMDHDVRPNLVGLGVDDFLSHFDKPENGDIVFDAQKRSGVLFHLVPAIKAAGNVGYTIIAESARAIAAIQDRLTQSLNRLELEYISGRSLEGMTYRSVPTDLRHDLEETAGHAKTVKSFRSFLDAHPEDLYRRGSSSGIVFHPAGYTVVGRTDAELEDLDAKARSLLSRFAESLIPSVTQGPAPKTGA